MTLRSPVAMFVAHLSLLCGTCSAQDLSPRGAQVEDSPESPSISKRWAFLVGLNDYAHLPTLKYCVKDIESLRDSLIQHGGYSPQNVLLLSDGEMSRFSATRSTILIELENMLGRIQGSDSILFAFAGHGEVDSSGKAWLIPSDGRAGSDQELELSAISVGDIYAKLQQSAAQQRLIILDACHSGGARGDSAATRFSPTNLPEGKGMIELLSCDAAELSYECPDLRRGVFSHFVTLGVSGQADLLGDQNGIVTVDEIYRFAHDRTSAYVTERFQRRQTPRQRGDIIGAIPVAIRTEVNAGVSDKDIISQLNAMESEKSIPIGFSRNAQSWLSVESDFAPAADVRLLLSLLSRSMLNLGQFNQLADARLEQVKSHIDSRTRMQERRLFGICVGINEYTGRALRGCVTDAQRVAQTLGSLGTPKDRVTLLTNQDATKERLIETLQSAVAESRKGDIIMIYYAGYGWGVAYDEDVNSGTFLKQQQENKWLLYASAAPDQRGEESHRDVGLDTSQTVLSCAELEQLLGSSEANILIFSDSQRMHFAWPPLYGDSSGTARTQKIPFGKFSQNGNRNDSRSVVFLAPEESFELGSLKGSSVFAHLVVRALTGGGDIEVVRNLPDIHELTRPPARGAGVLDRFVSDPTLPGSYLGSGNTAEDGFVELSEVVEFFRKYHARSKDVFSSKLHASGFLSGKATVLTRTSTSPR